MLDVIFKRSYKISELNLFGRERIIRGHLNII